jgi:RNA polymerase sigma factor (sigma-70 family)
MSDNRSIHLTKKLSDGDPVAAEQVFVTYAPYLRMVVRRQLTRRLRARFDSHDVVQSVWADTLSKLEKGNVDWDFRDEAGLRAFLVRLTRNKLVDFYRRHRVSLERETPLSSLEERSLPDANVDRPSELARAEELWERIRALCPQSHQELLRLKLLGFPLGEIAAKTGFHESSVRRILYGLAARLGADDAASTASQTV